jgi:hypothetical protein
MTLKLVVDSERPQSNESRVIRLYNDARALASTMTMEEARYAYDLLEHARDDLSRVLDRSGLHP